MRCFSTQLLVFGLAVGVPVASAQVPPAPPSVPRPPATPPTPTPGQRVSVEMKFIEPSGATLDQRRVAITLGKTETVSISRGGRTVSAETTVSRAAKDGCHHVDVTLRDKTIDATGHFNKTTWQSVSDPCGSDPITLGPKEETRLQIAVKAAP